MNIPLEDNTICVIQKVIQYYNIQVSNESIIEFLKSHPNYPSFKSICDAFNNWKIEHYPLRYNRKELRELQSPYIAHLNENGGLLVFVTKVWEGHVICYYTHRNPKKSLLTISLKMFWVNYITVSR
ncbi:MAG: hypothetical protein HC831_31475 [Chloroflexia bacterium]|nr:hypothetical protein [Chloroflexia bacterium]